MEVELPEPALQRLLLLAAELLGHLNADEVPASVRPFARFTPPKRRRLGGAAILAAVDRDEDFRARAAETLDDHPDGGTGDPIDVLIAAFLRRPQGWREVVAREGERWRDAHTDKVSSPEADR